MLRGSFLLWVWGLQGLRPARTLAPGGPCLHGASPQIHPGSPDTGTCMVGIVDFTSPPGQPPVGDSPALSWRHRVGEQRRETLP